MSDHFSGPAVIGNPAVDITDFYAFPSPERPEYLNPTDEPTCRCWHS
jgi:Domain of unknown function (DUF4331)